MTSLLWLTLAAFLLVDGRILVKRSESTQLRPNRRLRETAEFDSWLTAEQKAVLGPLMETPHAFKQKVMEFYAVLPTEEQAKWDAKYKPECTKWISKDVGTEDDEKNLINLFKTDVEAASTKWDEYIAKLPEKHQEKANVWKNECQKLLTDTPRQRRNLDDNLVVFTKWMTEDQKKEIDEMKSSGKTLDDIRVKSIEYFDTLPIDKQTSLKEEFKGICKTYLKKIATEHEVTDIKKLYETGQKGEVASKVSVIINRQPEDTKKVALKMQAVCTDVFTRSKRMKREKIDSAIEKHLTWLSPEQKREIRNMYGEGISKEEMRKTLMKWMKELTIDEQKDAKDKTVKQCYQWLEAAASKEEIDELHKLHETDHNACKTKVREYIQRLDTQTKIKVEQNLPFCEQIWYGDHSSHASHDHSSHHGHVHRKRRHDHHHTLEEVFENYLGWTTEAQKIDLKQIKESGDRDAFYKKILEFFEATKGETRTQAIGQLKSACKHYSKEFFGDDKIEEVKKMKEEGINYDMITLTMKKWAEEMEDKEKGKKAVKLINGCRGIFLSHSMDSQTLPRGRRDHHHHKLDDAFTSYLTWTTQEQKDALKALETAGDKDGIYKKVLEYFEATSGDIRKTAAEELRSACKHYAVDIFGADKVNELKTMRESGASVEELKKKATELINSVTDEVTKVKAQKLVGGCEKVYTALTASRKRRDHHHHKLDDAFTKYLTWTTQEQKDALKALETAGEKEGIYKKIMEYFEATSGDIRKTAAEELKGACKHYAVELFGEEKVTELKTLRESGASREILRNKILEFVKQITDEVKKAKAEKLAGGCTKIYDASMIQSRSRRHEHTLEEAFEKFLTWTTQEQKDTLQSVKETGDKEAVLHKILEFYQETSGDKRMTAQQELKSGCKHFGADVFGEEAIVGLKTLRESGASDDDVKARVHGLIGNITDPERKKKAEKLVSLCTKIFTSASRIRRDDYRIKLDEAFKNYLSWITPDQKKELKKLEVSDEIFQKVLEYFKEAKGDTKTTAITELEGACKVYAKKYFGDDKIEEIKIMKEAGKPVNEIAEKIDDFVDELPEYKQDRAKRIFAGCKVIFEADEAGHMRRLARIRRQEFRKIFNFFVVHSYSCFPLNASLPEHDEPSFSIAIECISHFEYEKALKIVFDLYDQLSDNRKASWCFTDKCYDIFSLDGFNKLEDVAPMEDNERNVQWYLSEVNKITDADNKLLIDFCVKAIRNRVKAKKETNN